MSHDHPFLDLPLTTDNIYRMFVSESPELQRAVTEWYRASRGQEPAIPDIQHGLFRSFEAQQFASRWGTMRRALQNAWPIASDPAPTDPTLPANEAELRQMPRLGMSIAALVVCSRCNIPETVKRFVDAGVRATRINLTSALWVSPSIIDCLPFKQQLDGVWDLDNWNAEYDARIAETKERMNAAGIAVTWTLWEDYSWSNRRGFRRADERDSEIPDGNLHPYRKNVQGFRWGGHYNGDIHEDDETLGAGDFDLSTLAIPNAWAKRFMDRLLPRLGLTYNALEIANEMPEKNLHRRVRDYARRVVPGAILQVNRQSDSPGQYANHKIGRDYDRIAFHGNRLKTLADFDRRWEEEHGQAIDTFTELLDFPEVEHARITFSSDGARISKDPINPYDWQKLGAVVRRVKAEGCSYDHQSRAKLSPAPNHDMIEVDRFREMTR